MKNRILKVVSWRCISILITLTVVYVATGDFKTSTRITLLLHLLLTFCHFLFESFWERNYESRSR